MYKYVGNRILTDVPEPRRRASTLSEWHSGYRAYRVDALADLDLASLLRRLRLRHRDHPGPARRGKRIVEVPIPTYYGDEICYVNGMEYAKDVTADVLRYRARRMGFGRAASAVAPTDDRLRAQAVHALLARRAARLARPPRPAARVLDVGCSDGRFAELRPRPGPPRRPASTWSSTRASPSGSTRSSRPTSTTALPADSAATTTWSSPATSSSTSSTPSAARRTSRDRLAAGGEILVSVPNFGHWYPRGRVASAGSTTTSAGRSTTATCGSSPAAPSSASSTTCGLRIVERGTVGSPFDVLERGGDDARAAPGGRAAPPGPTGPRPAPGRRMFGYQFLYRLETA